MKRLWHRFILRHTQETSRVSVPIWDYSARGILVRCQCGETWAL